MLLRGCRIGLFITGGIASYKMAELSRQLIKQGAQVQVAMTEAAQEFITPLTLQTLTKTAVLTDTFTQIEVDRIDHIHLADNIDLAIVAPATANVLGKMANGIADDIVTTTLMAVNRPRLIVPAMNEKMYANPANQRNLVQLRQDGYEVMEPAHGFLAEGYEGKGRLPEIEEIVQRVIRLHWQYQLPQLLKGKKVLVTAGGTRERIDPVRYITNDSSGRMGYAMAQAASYYGADVHLISSIKNLVTPVGIAVDYIESAAQLNQAVQQAFPTTDYLVMAAAVSDYRPKAMAKQKIKKDKSSPNASHLTLELVENPDVLASLGQAKDQQILIGFAAETENLIPYAQAKLAKKKADWIIANDVSNQAIGFNSAENAVTIVGQGGLTRTLAQADKLSIALQIWQFILEQAGPTKDTTVAPLV